MLTQSLIYLPGISGVVGVALFVFLRSKQLTFQVYGAFSFSLAVWLSFQFLTDARIGDGLLWLRLASVSLTVMASLFLLFVYSYSNKHRLPLYIKLLVALPIGFFAPLSFTPLLIEGVNYVGQGIVVATGPLYNFQAYFLVVCLLLCVGFLVARLGRSDGALRGQFYLLISAFMVGISGNVLAGMIFINNQAWQAARPLSIFFMLCIIAYAMIYKKLFDIRTYVVRAVAYVISFGVVVAIYLAATLVASSYLTHTSLSLSTTVTLMIITGIIAFLFQPLRVYFNKLTNRLFYRDYYDSEQLLDRFNRVVLSSTDLHQLLDSSMDTIQDSLKTEFIVFGLKHAGRRRWRFIGKSPTRMSEEDLEIIDVANGQMIESAFTIDDLGDGFTRLRKVMEKNDIALIARLDPSSSIHGTGMGYMFLGSKKSGNPFTRQDLNTIRIMVSELAIAIQNALRFEEIKSFTSTLQDKVNSATRNLRRTNDKLKAMDETKDDFISMASHQLRTPLTSIKGYVSMVLDGDMGQINDAQRQALNQALISSQRMVFLIADLLNLSRLKTGKFVIEPTPTKLSEIIESEVNQLQETAKARDLELIYRKPAHFPTLMLDETKIRQVAMNFMDNAIYYTHAGGHIAVELKETEKTVEFTVTDDGMGVPKHEQPHLFNKFYRAGNARKARPDGTGLGLFMAKKVIVAQGGSIIFNSKEGKGSTFGFSFAKAKLIAPPNANPVFHEPNALAAAEKSLNS